MRVGRRIDRALLVLSAVLAVAGCSTLSGSGTPREVEDLVTRTNLLLSATLEDFMTVFHDDYLHNGHDKDALPAMLEPNWIRMGFVRFEVNRVEKLGDNLYLVENAIVTPSRSIKDSQQILVENGSAYWYGNRKGVEH